MEIQTIQSFLSYYEKVRETTQSIINVIPPDQINWTYKAGKYTIGDLVRHIAAIERNLFAELILGNPVSYVGCAKELATNHEDILSYFHQAHTESMAIFGTLKDSDLYRKIKTVSGTQTSIANFLRALIVHEIHYRGALCIYLNCIGVETPPILGLTAEQVIQKANTTKSQAHGFLGMKEADRGSGCL